ncbi:MAG: cryptochrome/photolyase family protein [Rhodospirillales bacterium]|nr:cryptochrome/photolyase family protein [Rhodospirillales bacterium]
MSALRPVLGSQALAGIAALDLEAGNPVPMAQMMDACTQVPHHLRKFALVLSAMRCFSAPRAIGRGFSAAAEAAARSAR